LSSKTKTESNLTELSVAVLLLSLLALYTANIFVFLIASRHNDEICRNVVIAAAKAAVAGSDNKDAYAAAWQELGHAGYGGFFIDAPKISHYSDVIKDNQRQIKVQTQCIANLPVKVLIVADDLKKLLTLKRTYVIKIDLKPDAEKSSDKNESKQKSAEDTVNPEGSTDSEVQKDPKK
jgi:hypothetical protein